MRITGFAAAIAISLILAPGVSTAQADLFSRQTITGFAEVRLTAANGEKGWIRNGYGKTAASGGGGEFALRPSLAEADIIWQPSLGWNLKGTVVGQYQPSSSSRWVWARPS